jgi:hypothetical protein
MNQVQPVMQADANGVMYTERGAPSINPFLDSTRSYVNLADSFYNAMQLQLQKRLSYGVEFNVSYTWSKNTGNGPLGLKAAETGSDSGVGSGFQTSNMWDLKYDRGVLDQNTPHNFVFNYSYQLPIGEGHYFGKDMGTAGKMILGGWQLNGIITARAGLPINVTGPGFNANNYCRLCTSRPNLVPGGNNNPVIGDIDHWFDETQFDRVTPGYFGNVGRNTLTGPNLLKLDFSVFKMFPIGENKNLQFRAEFFNLPNHPNFAGPGGAVFRDTGELAPAVGQITKTVGTSRQVQLALKFEF